MYIDIVVCKYAVDSRVYLYKAPAWSHLKEGDEVVVETDRGEMWAEVVDSISCVPNDEHYNFAVKSFQAEEPLKRVLKKIRYVECDYSKEENDGKSND